MKNEKDIAEALEAKYKSEKIHVSACHNDIGKIASVKLPFKKNEWGDLLNGEGEYLPSCCANISRIRDILQEAIRSDGYCDVEELWEASLLAENHGFKKDDSPIGRMMKLWDIVKDDARTNREISDNGDINNDPQQAIEQLYKCSSIIVWNELFNWDNSSLDQIFSRNVTNEGALATLMSCVRTLFFKIQELSVGTVCGYGVFNEDKIGLTKSGIAVYRTEEMANDVCEMWNKPKRNTMEKITYTVHKCQVDIQHGIQKLS